MGKRNADHSRAGKKAKVGDEATSTARKGNPFTCPPSKYSLVVLRAVQPLIKLWRTEGSVHKLGSKNKFYGGLMVPSTLNYVIDLLSDRLSEVRSIHDRAKTEGNMRPYHLALIQMFHRLSCPSTEEFLEVEKKFRSRGDTSGLAELQRLKTIRVDEMQHHDGFLLDLLRGDRNLALKNKEKEEATESDSSDNSGSQHSGFHADNEEPPHNALETPESSWTDIKLRTHKRSVLSDPKLQSRRKDSLKTQYCPMITECKRDKQETAVYQDAGYGCIEMAANIEGGHYDLMYLPVFADQSYTYGILDVHAMVQMTDNKINYDAYKESCAEKGVQPLSEKELAERIKDGVDELQEWPELELKRYPNGKYLVGDFYKEDVWYPLPGEDVKNAGARIFFEAMLRIVVGDSVLSWTTNHVRLAYERRKEFMRLSRQADGNPQADRFVFLKETPSAQLLDLANQYLQKLNRVCLELKSREDQQHMHFEPPQQVQNVLEFLLLTLPASGRMLT